jgi:DNA modification methylase
MRNYAALKFAMSFAFAAAESLRLGFGGFGVAGAGGSDSPLTGEEYAQLETSLLADGCRDFLVLWRGLLLDGHNRLEICNRHGIPYDTVDIELPDRESAKLWIEENQIGRRNLSTDQRAAVAYRLMQRRVAISKRQRATKAGASHGSDRNLVVHGATKIQGQPRQRERTARQLQISTRKIREIARLAKTYPEIVDRIASGEVSLRDARESTLEKIRNRNITAALKTHVRGEGIHTGHMSHLFELVDDDSVDLFMTDPPWAKEALPLYTELGKLAQQKLKPGGFCFVLCGQLYLDQIIARLSEALDWYWLSAVVFSSGSHRIWTRKLTNNFRPLLVFAKRPAPPNAKHGWLSDLIHNTTADKRHHKHGQDVGQFQYYIENLTSPGQLVVDPFVGGGTVPEICITLGRKFVGTELNPGIAAAARARVAAAKVRMEECSKPQ